jgi:hypothetical protein
MIDLQRTPADIAMSLYLRYKAGWKCEVCAKPEAERSPFLDLSHFWPRGNAFRPTRYVEDNVVVAGRDCHRKFEEDPLGHRAFFLHRLGRERFDALARMSHSIVPRRLIDEAEIAREYRGKLRLEFGQTINGRGPALSTFVPGRVA